MRKIKVKRPEKETATTASDEGHDSSLSGAPSATLQDDCVKGMELHRYQAVNSSHTGNEKQNGDKVHLSSHRLFVTVLVALQ